MISIRWNGLLQIMFFMSLIGSCSSKQPSTDPSVSNVILTPVKPSVLRIIPHDSTAFTQGLFLYGKRIYESDGLYGESKIRILDTNGLLQKNSPVDPQVFAEGCALFGGKIFQLTWKEQVAIVYTTDIVPTAALRYTGEGWGLTSDSVHLIMSNGSDTIYYRDEKFNVVKKVRVTVNNRALDKLNELEFAKGYIYANVWYSDYIFKISGETGNVLGIIDCSELVNIEKPDSEHDVLNGIAYDKNNNLFYVTGKKWKNIFVVKFPE